MTNSGTRARRRCETQRRDAWALSFSSDLSEWASCMGTGVRLVRCAVRMCVESRSPFYLMSDSIVSRRLSRQRGPGYCTVQYVGQTAPDTSLSCIHYRAIGTHCTYTAVLTQNGMENMLFTARSTSSPSAPPSWAAPPARARPPAAAGRPGTRRDASRRMRRRCT